MWFLAAALDALAVFLNGQFNETLKTLDTAGSYVVTANV